MHERNVVRYLPAVFLGSVLVVLGHAPSALASEVDDLFDDIDFESLEAENRQRKRELERDKVTMQELVDREQAVREEREAVQAENEARAASRQAAQMEHQSEQSVWAPIIAGALKAYVLKDSGSGSGHSSAGASYSGGSSGCSDHVVASVEAQARSISIRDDQSVTTNARNGAAVLRQMSKKVAGCDPNFSRVLDRKAREWETTAGTLDPN